MAAIVAAGTTAGATLGVIARAWMRLISEDPEFSWNGTVFIVAGFSIFGFGQSAVAAARQRPDQGRKLTLLRGFAVLTMAPLFAGGGALMLPTVLGGGLAVARRQWPPLARGLCLPIAAAPVLTVAISLIDSFGWSWRTLGAVALMLDIYATIIWATRFTFSAQQHPHPRRRRKGVVVSLAIVATLATMAFAVAVVGLN